MSHSQAVFLSQDKTMSHSQAVFLPEDKTMSHCRAVFFLQNKIEFKSYKTPYNYSYWRYELREAGLKLSNTIKSTVTCAMANLKVSGSFPLVATYLLYLIRDVEANTEKDGKTQAIFQSYHFRSYF